jgi:hypothetical protein
MKVYHVELVVTNIEIYRVEADSKDQAYEIVAEGNAELIDTNSIDSSFDRCMEVEEE